MPWTALAAEESVIDPSLLLPSYGPSDVTPAPAPWPDARPSSGSRQARPTGHKIRDTAHAPRYFQFHSITGVVADLMVAKTLTTRLSVRKPAQLVRKQRRRRTTRCTLHGMKGRICIGSSACRGTPIDAVIEAYRTDCDHQDRTLLKWENTKATLDAGVSRKGWDRSRQTEAHIAALREHDL